MKLSDVEFLQKYDNWNKEDKNSLGVGITFGMIGLGVLCVGIALLCNNLSSPDGKVVDELFLFIMIFCVCAAICFIASTSIFKSRAKKQKEFLKEIGATETQASRRNIYIYNNPVLKEYLPLVRKICDFNPEARHQQEQIINGWYKNPIYDFWDTSDAFLYYLSTESSIRSSIRNLLRHEMSERKAFVSKLFQLAIAEDGIHLDEWHYLIDLMERLKFNWVSINFFKNRYYSLRTEFDEEERKKFAEEAAPSVSQINSYYAVLGLNEGATDDEIKKAYHALALVHHPDLPKNAERIQECEEMMAKINEAYNKIIKI